ncbi:hypothetical protein CVT25_001512 [Psilocybe cyanescens]|uniref:Uncharacterized protein n=1 Tax=Psilocybe cyanescens TaxID=93625 RepID=A0A409XHG1_PSICY|nr:hypothetical protein CVT25_001512 [Psilocybe cyanescens]
MLQSLKQSEPSFTPYSPPKGAAQKKKEYSPGGVVLALTHELARQLAGFAKDLYHFPDARLKVVYRAEGGGESARNMKMMGGVVLDGEGVEGEGGAGEGGDVGQQHGGMEHSADVMVGTPMKLLEMVRGRGWDKITEQQQQQQLALEDAAAKQHQEAYEDCEPKQLRRGRDKMPHFGTWRCKSKMGLENTSPTPVAHRTHLHNTPSYMHLARSADVVCTHKRDRLANPLIDSDNRNCTMAWDLKKMHKT